jgi:uncharacterized protein (DUF305 family)
MKTNKVLFVIILFFIALNSSLALMGDEFETVMTKMIERIRAVKMTGNPDSDFAQIMIEHDQGAIDLANAEIKSGKDAAVQSIARKIQSRKQAEIQELRKHHKKGKAAAPAASQQVANQSSMADNVNDVVADMEKWMKKTKFTGNTDVDFINTMLEHYRNGVKIANMEMRHGKDQAVKNLATKTKTDSQGEEKELGSWLDAHNK